MKNIKIKVLSLTTLIMLLAFSRAISYDSNDLYNEQIKVLEFRNTVTKGLVCSYLSVKKIQPILDISGKQTFSIDLSFADTVSPLYFYKFEKQNFPLFSVDRNILSDVELQTFNLNATLRLPYNFIGTLVFSYLPELEINKIIKYNLKVNLNFYYNFIKDALFKTGLYAGIGYNYTTGLSVIQNNLSSTISETNVTFIGNLNSHWNYQGINFSLFANNQLLIFNFWGRVDYYILFGGINSQFEGASSVSAVANCLLIDNNTIYGIVFSGGMEIALGWFKINIEAGKDLLSSGMYVNTGIRIGY